MVAELGFILLIFAFVLSAIHLFFSTRVCFINFSEDNFSILRKINFSICLLLITSFLFLIISYVLSDFSVLNIYNNSHTNKPLLYKVSGTWGNHEGSLLMWLAFLGGYGFFLTLYTKNNNKKFTAKVFFTSNIVNIGFIGFTIFTSNPFLRISPIPEEGKGLNPVLQDPGLAFHPPLLYLGYVGLTIPFAYSIAALLEGKIDRRWANEIRPWILISWIFLTLGITLGSFWAYYELGWGGWWFWDPVENVSLLPWLLLTALLHSNRVTEKRDNLKSWTILLSIIAFSLTLLGTFIVRSGLLTSVHAFASDPARGIYILSFLFLITGASLILYVIKYDKIESDEKLNFLSKEGGLLLNNVFLCASTVTILLGTLWPLFVEVMIGKDISVGAPYFNLVFLPIIMPAIFVSGVIININWKRNTVENLLKKLNKAIIIFVFLVGVILFLLEGPIIFFIGIILSIWLLISIINDFYEKIRTKKSISDIKLSKAFSIPISTYGMYLAHFGLAVFILGVAISDSKKLYYEGVMKEKEIVKVEKFKIQLKEIIEKKEKNWISQTGNFSVEGFKKNISMFAERRLYLDTGMPSTEAAIYRNFFSHLYIVMGQEQPLNSGKRIVRIYFNPFIILIWSGAFLMAFGGLISICDKKRNR